MSVSEAEEYKKTTLTGANVPYNPKDPRQEPRDVNKLETSDGIYNYCFIICFNALINKSKNLLLVDKRSLMFQSCLFVCVKAKRPNHPFFSHVGTEPPLPGKLTSTLGSKVSCS